jgi:hypothetical protein
MTISLLSSWSPFRMKVPSNWIVLLTRSQSYFTTGGLPPISSFWRQTPWDSQPAMVFQLNTCCPSPYVREDGSVVQNCCWPSPAQSFSGPSPAVLMTILYCLRFETLPTWRARSPYLYPPGTGWPGYTPGHWVPFSSPPTTRRTTMEVFDPSSTRDLNYSCLSCPPYSSFDRTGWRIPFATVPLFLQAYPLPRERVYRAVA